MIGTITTDSDSNYSFQWSAEPKDPFDDVVEVYAAFEGSSSFGASRSQQINVEVN